MQSSATDVDGSALVHFGAKEARGEEIRVEAANPSSRIGTGTGTDAGRQAKSSDGLGQNARQRQADLRIVVEALGKDFRMLLAEKSCDW